MISKRIEKELNSFFNEIEAFKKITPGLQVHAYHKGKKVVDLNLGETYPYYDLASLTKVLFTSTIFMHMFETKDKILEDKILKYLPWFFHPSLSVRQLLTHTTGLISWKPLYIHFDLNQPVEIRWDKLRTLLSEEKPDLILKAQYSDLNYLLLGFLLKQEMHASLQELWSKVADEMDLSETHFHADNKPLYDVKKYAPTELCPWRQRRLQGEVHDENAWSLGGIAPHSGLFGSMGDLGKWFLYLRAQYLGESSGSKSKFISQQTLQTFWQRAISKEHGDWALGFMLPSEKKSTAGNLFSKLSIGHTGFTGTSFWYDLKEDLAVMILSNRVYYGRENREAFNLIRTKVHDLCHQQILKP